MSVQIRDFELEREPGHSNNISTHLSCEPADVDLVHEVIKALGCLQLELAEHVSWYRGLLSQAGGEHETAEGEEEQGQHCEECSGPGSLSNCGQQGPGQNMSRCYLHYTTSLALDLCVCYFTCELSCDIHL